jgi:murein DD-endopeptidase MepM/ murein hydrolase activator NlpD
VEGSCLCRARLSQLLFSTRLFTVSAVLAVAGLGGAVHAASASATSPAARLVIPATASNDRDEGFRRLLGQWKAFDQPATPKASLPSQRPVDSSRYTSLFGVRNNPFHSTAAMHAGIDLAAPTGTPVHATADGIVSRAEIASDYGNLVQLNHGASVQTRYGHLSRILVKAGQSVHRGDVIALVGSTGRSTGSHLHYEVRVAGRAIDPLPFMARGDEQLTLQQTVGPAAGSPTAIGGPTADE